MSYDTKTDTTEQTNRSMEGRVRRPRQTKTMVVPSANYNNLPAEVPRSEKNPGHQNKVNQNRKGIKKTNKTKVRVEVVASPTSFQGPPLGATTCKYPVIQSASPYHPTTPPYHHHRHPDQSKMKKIGLLRRFTSYSSVYLATPGVESHGLTPGLPPSLAGILVAEILGTP